MRIKILFKVLTLCLIISSCISHELDQQVDRFMQNVEIAKLEKEYDRKVSEVFSVSFQIPPINYFEFLISQIRKIDENPEGKRLLDLANQLFKAVNLLRQDDSVSISSSSVELSSNPLKLLITFQDDSSAFQGVISNGRISKLSLNLNLIANKIFWHDELGLCTLIPAPCNIITKIDGQHQLVYITSCADPFYMLVAHELIHMTHFLQSYINDYCKNFLYNDKVIDIIRLEQLKQKLRGHKFSLIDTLQVISQTTSENIDQLEQLFQDDKRFYTKYKYALSLSTREFIRTLINNFTKSHPNDATAIKNYQHEFFTIFPELHNQLTCRQSFTELCDKLEERQTVIGNNISELTMRLAGGLPIRYIYQSSEDNTYEDLGVLLSIIQQTEYEKSFTSEFLVSYILNPRNAKFFDTRLIHKQINYKLLSDQLFKDFSLSEEKKKMEEITIIPEIAMIPKKTSIQPKTKQILLEVIGDFEKGDTTEAILDKLFDKKENLSILIIRALTILGTQIDPKIKKSELLSDTSKLEEFASKIKSLKPKLGLSMTHDVSQQMPIPPAMPHISTNSKGSGD